MSLTKVIRYVSGVTTIFSGSPLDPWDLRGTRRAPESQTETSANQNISLTKHVRYVSRVTKMNLGSIPDPWGPQELRVWQVEAELCIFNLNS